jgi:hypothetical protein
MAAPFAGDSQVVASLVPFNAVRLNSPPAGAKLSEDVSEFVPQRAIDLLWMLKQPRV